ncbi:MAG TPA: DNA-directed RNA polymerase subunit alpha C-terminal domain-containing protein [Patescibacteria group bacterium]|nr:DNA-directed RNA polymerase subunit alpha C-terminal domain-containing protein [Patescibacteria group bacterium]
MSYSPVSICIYCMLRRFWQVDRRGLNKLEAMGILTVATICQKTRRDLRQIRGVGNLTIAEVERILAIFNEKLKEDLPLFR